MNCPNCKSDKNVKLIVHSGKYEVPSNYLGYHCFKCRYGFIHYATQPDTEIDFKSKTILYSEMVND